VAGETPNGQWLIPPKALTLIQKTLVDPDDDVEIELRPNEILFRTSKVMIYSRLVEGRFPNYRDVFPPNANIRIPVAVGKLHGVIRQAKIVTNDESKGVDFHFREGLLTLESRGADLGSSEITLPIGYEGDDIDITFDPQLLIDALRVLDSDEEISVDIVDTRRATVLRSGDEYEYVVMPLTRER
jgi:DNA polymerase-3 subunit beta